MKCIIAKENPMMLDLILKEYAAFYRKQFDEDLSDYIHSKYGTFLASPHTIVVINEGEDSYPIGIVHLGIINDWGEIRLFYMRPTFFSKDSFTSLWLAITAHFPHKVKRIVFQSRLLAVPPYSQIPEFDIVFTNYTRSEYSLDVASYALKGENSIFDLTPVVPTDKKSLGFLCFLTFKNSLEYDIIPYYQNIDYAQALIKNITNNSMGVFLQDISFVVKKDAIPVGLILASKLKDNKVLLLVFGMFESLRGKGYGKALLHTYLLRVKEHNYAGITLTVTEENASAVALYTAAGFTKGSAFPLFIHEIVKRPERLPKHTVTTFEPETIHTKRKGR